MEGKAVCIVVGILGIISAVLGFAAEGTKVKGNQITVDIQNDVCVYPSSPAAVLGFISAVTLLVAFIIINSVGGCFCCYKAKGCECGAALVCFIVSWLTFVVGFFLMLGSAAQSRSGNMSRLRVQDINFYYCYYVKGGVFAAAACLSLISIALGIAYYRNLASKEINGPLQPNAHIAMGQAHFPPPTYQPTYV